MLCRQRNKSVFLVAVRFLSNLFTRTASNYSNPRLGIATPEQMNAAMELLLLTPHQRVGAEEIDAFTQSLRARGIDLSNMRIAARGDRLTYALLPAVLPGRTLMLLSGSPAERAGIRVGDQIVRAGTRTVRNTFDWEARLLDVRADQSHRP